MRTEASYILAGAERQFSFPQPRAYNPLLPLRVLERRLSPQETANRPDFKKARRVLWAYDHGAGVTLTAIADEWFLTPEVIRQGIWKVCYRFSYRYKPFYSVRMEQEAGWKGPFTKDGTRDRAQLITAHMLDFEVEACRDVVRGELSEIGFVLAARVHRKEYR